MKKSGSTSSSKSPSLRRIQADIRELALSPSDRYHAAPLESDMFEWHFTIRGSEGTDFEHGIYHGRILLPPEYPFKPPHIIFLTKSGRFEINTKICLSFSAFHPELWQPAWGIRLILEALIAFLPTPADGALGSLDWTSAERKALAKESQRFFCPTCNCHVRDLLPKKSSSTPNKKEGTNNDEQGSPQKSAFQKEIEQLQMWQALEHPKQEEAKESTPKSNVAPPAVEAAASTTDTPSSPAAAATNTTPATDQPPESTKDSALDPTPPKDHSPPKNTATSSSPLNQENDSIAFLGDIVTPRSTGKSTKENVESSMLSKGPPLQTNTKDEEDLDKASRNATVSSPPPPTSSPPLLSKLPAVSSPVTETSASPSHASNRVEGTDTARAQTAAPDEEEQEPLLTAPTAVDDPNPEQLRGDHADTDQEHKPNPDVPTWLDPLLQMIILILSVTAFCLLRKIQTLLSELRSLEE